MYGIAGAVYTPGMPQLDSYDAAAREAKRIARQQRRSSKKDWDTCAKKHVSNRQERRDPGYKTRSR